MEMDSTLNTTYEALKDSVEAVKLKQQNQLRNLVLRAKYNNYTTSVQRSTEDDINTTSTGNMSARLNNLHQVFKEDIQQKIPFKELKTLHSTEILEDDPSPTFFKSKMRKIINNNENDNDYTNLSTPRSLSGGSIRKSKHSFREDTPQTKNSLLDSYKQDSLEDDAAHFKNSTNISSSFLEDINLSTYCAPSTNQIHMNFIMLIGLIAGLLVSKILQYLQLYLSWLSEQILKLRNNLMGTISLWNFLNFDDTRHLQVRSKLLLLPLIFVCSLVYSLIYILHFIVRFLLTSAPDGLIKFIQNLHN